MGGVGPSRLLDHDIDQVAVNPKTKRFVLGPPMYGAAVGLPESIPISGH